MTVHRAPLTKGCKSVLGSNLAVHTPELLISFGREGDVLLSVREESENTNTLGSSRNIPVNCPKRIEEGTSQKVKRPIAQLQCLYTNAHEVEKKSKRRKGVGYQEELKNYDPVVIMET